MTAALASQGSCPRESDTGVGILMKFSSSTERLASGRTFIGSGNSMCGDWEI